MARRKAAERCTILPWLTAKHDCKEGRFLQIGNSLFLSPQWKELTHGARCLYLAMTLEAGGRREFIFPKAAAEKYGVAPTSFWRYVDELIIAGFIVKQRSGANVRQPNEYAFSDAWKCSPSP